MHQRTKRSRHLLGRLGLVVLWAAAAAAVAWGAEATEDDANNTPAAHSYVRSLQNYRNTYDHRNYVYVCHRRGRDDYTKREVLDYEVPSIIAAGGGHVGETVPGTRDDTSGFYYVFDVNCQPTPAASCGSDTRTCPDGRVVERDPRQGCAFVPCPEAHCCDANEEPPCPGGSIMRGPQCCPTGTWVCPGIFGSYYCGAELGNIRRGFGPVCATASFGTAAMVDAFVPVPAPPPPPAPPAVNCQACGGCGYFDGCNSCSCGTNGNNVGCTNRFCPNEQREKPRCYECPSSAAIVAPPPPPPPPAPTTTCSSCPCGFFDGCNTCACNRDGSSICTLRACGPKELSTPRCHACSAPAEVAAAEPQQPSVGCDTCPCGYHDGCNECGCHSDGTGFCSRMYCDVYDTPYCKACPDERASCPSDTRTCPDGSTVSRDPELQCSFPACPQLRSCDGGGYRMCPNRKWVALDPRTDCRSFYPCD